MIQFGAGWNSSAILIEINANDFNTCSSTNEHTIIGSVLYSYILKMNIFHLPFLIRSENNSTTIVSATIGTIAIRVRRNFMLRIALNHQITNSYIMQVDILIDHCFAISR